MKLEAVKQAAVVAVKLGNAARAKLLAPEQEPLGSQQIADRNYKRVRAVRRMKQLQVKE